MVNTKSQKKRNELDSKNEEKTNSEESSKSKSIKNSIKTEENKNNKKIDYSNVVAIVFAVIVLGLFVFVIYGIKNRAPTQGPALLQEDYNGYTFVKDNAGHWVTIIKTVNGDTEIPFYYHPKQLEDMSYDKKINQLLSLTQKKKGKMTIAFGAELTNPNLPGEGSQTVAAYEIIKVGINVFGMPVETAMIDNINGTNFTLLNCSNSTIDNFIVEMRLGNKSQVYSKGGCAVIEAANLSDTIKLADQFVYKITGILS